MAHRTRVLAAAAAALLAAACAKSGSTGPSNDGSTALAVTASKQTIPADGSAFVIIHAEGGAPGTLTVTTTKGAFPGGLTSLTMDATPFDLALQTCDSRLDTTCAGLASVTVLDKSLTRRGVSITLAQLEICGNGRDDDGNGKMDCADTFACPQGTACTTHGMSCGADAKCSACSGNGGTPEVKETSCGDGFDNDCDGLVDCADPDCATQTCFGATATAPATGLTSGKCDATTKTCLCKPVAEVCNDGLDNDCDGKSDCDDTDCQPVSNNPGKICDAVGHSCSPPSLTGGRSVCGVVCSGNGGTPQPLGQETNCFDNVDNDCNGVADCQDPHCAEAKFACGANGQICSDTQFSCVCGQGEPFGETSCGDHVDNDCDGKVDCKDPDCSTTSQPCGDHGMRCTTAGTCTCQPPNGGLAQTKETSCTDGIDNDCDGFVDCEDPDCRPTTAGAYGASCGTGSQPSYGYKCDFTGQCACSYGALVETSCGDTVDNDCNGLADCKDVAACNGKPCGLNGRSCNDAAQCACSGNGGTPEAQEQTCDDGKDNDCDGKADCDDPDCANAACNPAYAAYVCKLTGTSGAYTCRDNSGYLLTLSASSTRLPADGSAQSIVTATLTRDNGMGTFVGQNGETISFTTSLGAVTSSAITSGTGANAGKATATFTSSAAGGPAVITATFVPDPAISPDPVIARVSIDQPSVGQVKLVQVQYPILGVRSSGFQETDAITFQVLDTEQKPYPAGLDVQFQHQNLGGGSFVGSTPTCDGSNLCTAVAKTLSDGKVTVTLHSGTAYSVVAVTALAQGGGGSAVASPTNLAIVGAKASGDHLSVMCTPTNVPAFFSHDCSNSTYAGPDSEITCWVGVQDRFNNVLGVASLVNFRSEAGAAGPPATTPMYDTSKQPSDQDTLGTARDFISVTNARLPDDVEPWVGEPSASASQYPNACPKATYNPRDGVSTVVVFMNGEEGFVDQNANGEYDPGEPFIDVGEPFLDKNDNGICDPGELIQDVNVPGNTPGVCDGPNGQWDRNTVIWAETRVVFSGNAAVLTVPSGSGTTEILSRFFDPLLSPTPPEPTATASFVVNAAQAGPPAVPPSWMDLDLFWTDLNLNPPSHLTTYGVTKTGQITVAMTQSPSTIDNLGMSFSRVLCDAPVPADTSPAHCSNTCKWSKCYYVTTLGNFVNGTRGRVRITGGSKPDPDMVTVTGTATLNSVTVKVNANGWNQ